MQIQIQYNMVLHQLHIRLISIFRDLPTICIPLHILDNNKLLYIQIQSSFIHGCVLQQMTEWVWREGELNSRDKSAYAGD